MAARKRKTDEEVAKTIATPVEDEIFEAMDKAIAASAEDADVLAPEEQKVAPVEAVEESPEQENNSLKTGECKVFSARVYPSSVSKQVKYLAIGKVFILDADAHDGRVIVSLDELGTKRGWADVTDLMG